MKTGPYCDWLFLVFPSVQNHRHVEFGVIVDVMVKRFTLVVVFHKQFATIVTSFNWELKNFRGENFFV